MEALKDAVATTVGSAACVLVGQPFDTVKVRVQVLSAEYGISSLACIRKTGRQQQGVGWRGAQRRLQQYQWEHTEMKNYT